MWVVIGIKMDLNENITIKNRKTGESKSIKRSELSNYGLPLDYRLNKNTGAGTISQSSTNISNDYSDLIKKYFTPDQWNNAYRVMMGESGGRANAVGDNFPIRGETIPSYGLFQIRALPGRPDPSLLSDPEFNVRYAAQMQKTQGWRPWTAARKLGIK